MSIYIGKDVKLKEELENYFKANDLRNVRKPQQDLSHFLRTDYTKKLFRQEADSSQPNDTPSRRSIFDKNVRLYDGIGTYSGYVPTITTKQDRHPNAGVVSYRNGRAGKSNFRYLTGRECLLLMGFDDSDYESIMRGNFMRNVSETFFNNNKVVKMAGNSIVVPVLEEVFKQMIEIDKQLLNKATVTETADEVQPLGELSFAV